MQVNNNTNGFVPFGKAKEKAESSLEKMAKATSDKINDAALRSIAGLLNSNANVLTQGLNNANDTISYLQVADGALSSVNDDSQHLNELSVKMNNSALSAEQKNALSSEFSKLSENIHRTLNDTSYNGKAVFNGSFQASFAEGDITVKLDAPKTDTLNIAQQSTVQDFMKQVNSLRQEVGSSANSVQSSANALIENQKNSKIAASNMIDTDMTKEVNEFKKEDLLSNVGLLVQAHKTDALQGRMQALLA